MKRTAPPVLRFRPWYMILLLLAVMSVRLNSQEGINGYLVHAASHNPALKAKYNLYLAALERVEQQGALPDPTLSFGYFLSPVETRVGAQRFKLSLSQMFPWAGTTKVRRQAASSLAKMRFEEFQEVKNKLFLEIKYKWLALYQLEQEIKINKANLEILKTYEPITRTKYEANLVSLADLIRVQIQLDEAKTELDLLELRRVPLLSDFNILLNRPSDAPVLIPDSLTAKLPVRMTADSVLSHQPRLLAAKEQIRALTSQEALAVLKRKPNLGFGLDYAFVTEREGIALEDNGRDILMPMVSVSLPVFGKKNKAQLQEAALNRESAEARLEAISNDLQNAWTNARYLRESAETEMRFYQQEIDKTKLLLKVLIGEYSTNSRNFEELLLTQQRLLELQLSEIRASIKFYRAIYQKDYLSATTLNQFE